MHRVPFSPSLAIGTDIVHIPRIWRIISRANGRGLTSFAYRLLHPLEIQSLSRRHPQWQELHQRPFADVQARALVQWLGGRFAAKEAARKALGAHKLGWKDVRVELEEASGQPLMICLTPDVNNEIVELEAKLSIAHDSDYAVATVLAAPLHASVTNKFV